MHKLLHFDLDFILPSHFGGVGFASAAAMACRSAESCFWFLPTHTSRSCSESFHEDSSAMLRNTRLSNRGVNDKFFWIPRREFTTADSLTSLSCFCLRLSTLDFRRSQSDLPTCGAKADRTGSGGFE